MNKDFCFIFSLRTRPWAGVFILCGILSGCAYLSKPKFPEGVYRVEFDELPYVGKSSAGQKITLGGFSGLHYLGKSARGFYRFLTVVDEGPTSEAYNGNRPHLLPDFQLRLIVFAIDPEFEGAEIEESFLLHDHKGPMTGLPPERWAEDPVDTFDYLAHYDNDGMDVEAVTRLNNTFWVAEEYQPSLVAFNADGKLIHRYYPGQELPKLFKKRRLHRGFEGLTAFEQKLWAFLESPLDSGPKDLKVPVLVFDPTNNHSEIMYYPIENSRADRIGDVTAMGKHGLLVLEQSASEGPESFKKVFLAKPQDGKKVLKKKLVVDLAKLGIHLAKLEGISFFENRYIAIINDNDFGLHGKPDYLKSGLVPTKAEESYIFILDLNSPNLNLHGL